MGRGAEQERALRLREFCREVPWPSIGQMADGDEVVACFLVLEARRAEARNNKPYLRLTLGDRTGTIDGFVWEEVERWEPVCVVDSVVGVRGRVGSFQDKLQLKVQSVDRIAVEPNDYEHLLATSPRPREEMERDLDARVASVADPSLRSLLDRCVGARTDLGAEFRIHPAAMRNHHAYVGGLMEHSLSVAGSCAALVEHYAVQGVTLDRDLLVTAALLHDIGKVRELRAPPSSGYTTEGRLLGHIVIGMQLIATEAAEIEGIDPGRLLLLQHLVASHQGRPEWDSPRTPQMLEALVLHYADDLDAKMNAAARLVAGVEEGEWTAYDRSLARSFFRPAAAAGRIARLREATADTVAPDAASPATDRPDSGVPPAAPERGIPSGAPSPAVTDPAAPTAGPTEATAPTIPSSGAHSPDHLDRDRGEGPAERAGGDPGHEHADAFDLFGDRPSE